MKGASTNPMQRVIGPSIEGFSEAKSEQNGQSEQNDEVNGRKSKWKTN